MKLNMINVMWGLVGIVIMGGIYCLSSNNVDEVVLTEGKKMSEYVRTVLK